MLGLKLNRVSKRGHSKQMCIDLSQSSPLQPHINEDFKQHNVPPQPDWHATMLIINQKIISHFDNSGGLLFHMMLVARKQQSQLIITMVSICKEW